MLSIEEMMQIADTGDLVMFKGNSIACSIQRTLTGGEYDHVAMFLRFSNGALVYFESSANCGVQVFSWEFFVERRSHLHFNKVAFRKLRFKREVGLIRKLEEFVKTVRGFNYNLDLNKLWQKKCEDDITNIQPDKTYFCSELVASCYKCIGLFPEDLAAS